MKDWRKQENYEFTRSLDDQGWAWEFLRRNPEYRKDFEVRRKEFLSLRKSGFKFSFFDCDHETDDPGFYIPFIEGYDDPENPREDRWGCSAYCDPKQDKLDNFAIFPLKTDWSWSAYYGLEWTAMLLSPEKIRDFRTATVELEPFCVAFVCDLSQPVTPQMERARITLQGEQDLFKKESVLEVRRVHRHPRLWPHYLRILDALESGAKPVEIADHLNQESPTGDSLADEKKIYDQIEAAIRMSQPAGYRTIIVEG